MNEPNPKTHPIGYDRHPSGLWLPLLRRYLLLILVLNFAWEVAQLPLYTIWSERPAPYLLWAVVHCTAGDLLIANTALVFALAVVGTASWPRDSYWRVGLVATMLGVSYTIFSEWLNIEIRRSWTYSDAMPVVPLVGAGLSPLAQWLIVPPAALYLARRSLLRVETAEQVVEETEHSAP